MYYRIRACGETVTEFYADPPLDAAERLAIRREVSKRERIPMHYIRVQPRARFPVEKLFDSG